ncbi:MAG: CvpA family protein [Maricaulaceae bacterium]
MQIGSWSFTGFDIAVLLVIFVSLVMAANRGFFRELISISALVVAALIALFAYGRFRFSLRDIISPDRLSDAILALGTFAIVYMLCVLLFSGTIRSLRGKNVGIKDRFIGALFGIARGLLACALVTMVISSSYQDKKTAYEFKEKLEAQGTIISEDLLKSAPKSLKDAFKQGEPELPKILQGSLFYPLLDRIGDGIRALPITNMENFADKLKSGENLF